MRFYSQVSSLFTGMSKTLDAQTYLTLRHARIVTPDDIYADASLHLEDGLIVGHSSNREDRTVPAKNVLDLRGLTLFPGFTDVHIHGAMGVDVLDAEAGDLLRVSKYLARQGVTSWLPTLVPAPAADYTRAARAVERLMDEQSQDTQAATGARALGLHYEGPFVNSLQCGALRTAYFHTYTDAADLDDLATVQREGAAHLMTVAPEIEGGIELIEELKRRGWIVSIGHTRAPVDVLEQARQAGAQHMTHFPNAMSPLHQRAPGPVGWGLMRDDVTCDVIADGVHCDPLILELVLRCKGAGRVLLISDAVAPAGLGDGEFQVWNETIKVAGGRTSNERGSIAGSVINLHDAVRMMRLLGCTENEVAQMASLNPARLLGVDGECGSIEIGKRADLVALDADGHVRLTLVGGRVAYSNLDVRDAV